MTKLCPRGKAAAKRKFKVYPSAYANAYASKICAGKIKDPSGVKRKDFKGPKPAKRGGVMKVKKAGLGLLMIANQIRKEGKKKGRQQAEEGMKQDKQYQEYLASQQGQGTGTTQMSMGGMTPQGTGSYIKQDIDGDESFTNPSTQAYYKDLLG
tara:strand:+ start:164 stop:622 length:459 start_codon:yes stop_codon:yes gene_type:complete